MTPTARTELYRLQYEEAMKRVEADKKRKRRAAAVVQEHDGE
jgi:hypothetical protein